MELRGIRFGSVLDASGARGFFGEGYPHHMALKCFGLDFTGSTFVAKTVTLHPRKGNMYVRNDGTVPWWHPKPECIVVKPKHGAMLNAVGLSNPGAEAMFAQGKWQQRQDPFFLSFMAVGKTKSERMEELYLFSKILLSQLGTFRARIGLQLNYSCPNAEVHIHELASEVIGGLSIAAALNIPLMPKFNALFPVDVMATVAQHPACDALCVTNTIPWGAIPNKIDWAGLFGSERSPLEKFGGGGLSGAPILGIGVDCVARMRAHGIIKPINAGGGIMGPEDVDRYVYAGASSISLGTIAMVRPWRMRSAIARAREALYLSQ